MIRVADFIINQLYQNGVKNIYTVSGRGALFLTDAIAKHKLINNIAMHHEQSAAFAAIAESQYTNNISACLVSTGCASTNTITGLLCAWQDNIPCVFISGQNILKETSNYTGLNIRTYGQQEANIIPIVKSITKYAVMIKKPEDILVELDRALNEAISGRPGPVWIDIPLDIQSALIENKNIDIQEILVRNKPKFPDKNDLLQICNTIRKSKRPLVLIGSGIRSSNSESQLINFIEKNRIPLVYSNSSPDIYGSCNELSIGSVGSMGASRSGNFALQNCDFLLVIGNRLNSYLTGLDFCKFAREAFVCVVDIDEIEHKKESVRIDKFLQADANFFLRKINEITFNLEINDWVQTCLNWKNMFSQLEPEFCSSDKIDLYQLSKQLSENLPECSSLVTDSGFIEVILPTNVIFKSGQRCIHPVSQGSMGFALPAAIGVYLSSKKHTIAVIGDGSIMMNIQELQTISHNKLPIKIIVINNNVYGIIRRRQIDLFRNRTIGTDNTNGVSCPSFLKVANAFDLDYQKIDNINELEAGLKKLMETNSPTICEIFCREDQSYIEIGVTKNNNNKFVRRPLEDQIPFLDRDLFLNQMIIKPIDQ